MSSRFVCDGAERRRRLRDPDVPWNGIDYLEVLDSEAPAGFARQRLLVVRFFKPIAGLLDARNVRIAGGVRFPVIAVRWTFSGASFADGSVPGSLVTSEQRSDLLELLARFRPSAPESGIPRSASSSSSSSSSSSAAGGGQQLGHLLVIYTDGPSDFSTYRLCIVAAPAAAPVVFSSSSSSSGSTAAPVSLLEDGASPPAPPGFDPPSSCIAFSFKVDCVADLDCMPAPVSCAPESVAAPLIDYLSKDYPSFLRLMFDRLAQVVPDWRERNAADVGVAIVELLAHAADYVSYAQDAVATEAYLGTARRRLSVVRHAKLVGYRAGQGANARTLVAIEVQAGSSIDRFPLPRGTAVLTLQRSGELQDGVEQAPRFATLTDITLHSGLNRIQLYLWGADRDAAPDAKVRCCLRRGATRATLDNTGDGLRGLAARAWPLLIFMDAQSGRCHPVVLTRCTFGEDPLFSEPSGLAQRILDVEWAAQDALPFDLAVELASPLAGLRSPPNVVACGNVVLAQHAERVEELVRPDAVSAPAPIAISTLIERAGSSRPVTLELTRGPVTFGVDLPLPPGTATQPTRQPAPSAARLLDPGPVERRPLIQLSAGGQHWEWRPDLLDSGPFDRHFTVDVLDDERASIRFAPLIRRTRGNLRIEYWVGNGRQGNLGRDTLLRLESGTSSPLPAGVRSVSNPLPARGGLDAEPIEQIRLAAPSALRRQRRAVTEADYEARAAEHPDVQKAVAVRRWTGSWYTVFVAIDARGQRAANADFQSELLEFLEPFRLAGEDLQIELPSFVALDIELSVCVAPDHSHSRVKEDLMRRFSTAELPEQGRGFFHPDQFTFNQSLYLSQLLEVALGVPGVAWIDIGESAPVRRFARLGQASNAELEAGVIRAGRQEILRADSDPNQPENGRIEFFMQGGL